MEVEEHVAQTEADGAELAVAAASAGFDAQVPGTDWTVRDLVTHVGGVHRWAADIVASASPTGDTESARRVGAAQPDDSLLDWFLEGHEQLIAVLRSAPAGLECFTFLPAPSPLAFWARRQAHETAIHRADAQLAAGHEPIFGTAFAQDGIDELLNGFGRRKSNAIATPGTLGLRASDKGDSWTVTLGGERLVAGRGIESTDATVTGSSGDLYLWLWNRSAAVTIDGDAALADLWRTVQVRWS